jgi:hypothetical protein
MDARTFFTDNLTNNLFEPKTKRYSSDLSQLIFIANRMFKLSTGT